MLTTTSGTDPSWFAFTKRSVGNRLAKGQLQLARSPLAAHRFSMPSWASIDDIHHGMRMSGSLLPRSSRT